jgi:hypothetical protein
VTTTQRGFGFSLNFLLIIGLGFILPSIGILAYGRISLRYGELRAKRHYKLVIFMSENG